MKNTRKHKQRIKAYKLANFHDTIDIAYEIANKEWNLKQQKGERCYTNNVP